MSRCSAACIWVDVIAGSSGSEESGKNPSRFLEEVAGGTPITITQGRKANAILVPRDTWARLLIRLQELEDELETRELLADPTVQRRLKERLPARGVPLAAARAHVRAHRKRRS